MDSKKEKKKIRVGISVGDLNGIGCEVALNCFLDNRMLDFCTPLFFASNKAISDQQERAETIRLASRSLSMPSVLMAYFIAEKAAAAASTCLD